MSNENQTFRTLTREDLSKLIEKLKKKIVSRDNFIKLQGDKIKVQEREIQHWKDKYEEIAEELRKIEHPFTDFVSGDEELPENYQDPSSSPLTLPRHESFSVEEIVKGLKEALETTILTFTSKLSCGGFDNSAESVRQLFHVKDLQKEISSGHHKLLIINFWAKIDLCEQIDPVFESLSHKYKGTVFLKVNVDECSDIAGDYGIEVMPTFVFLICGKEVRRFTRSDVGIMSTKISEETSGFDSTKVQLVSGKEELQNQITSAYRKLVVIDFTAKWCSPCQLITPVFESLSHKYKGTVFLKVDVDECSDIAGDYDVQAMPTFVFLKSEKEVGRVRGADVEGIEKNLQAFANESFVGQGMTLGGNASDSSTSSVGDLLDSFGNFELVDAPQPTKDSDVNLENEEIGKTMLQIDESKPTCNIQIRLANGTKLKTKVNLGHTIQQIREFVTLSRPEFADKPFIFITTHPTKELSDETLTVEAAQIINTIIVQKLVNF